MTFSDSAPSNTIIWFRRDLRLHDNAALQAALRSGGSVICLYIKSPNDPYAGAMGAAQAWWLHHSLKALGAQLAKLGNQLVLKTGDPLTVLQELVGEHKATAVYWNRRYDPAGIAQDTIVKASLKSMGISCQSFTGNLLHDPITFKTRTGGPYRLYTPFWRALGTSGEPDLPYEAPATIAAPLIPVASETLANWHLLPSNPDWSPGFADLWTPGEAGAHQKLDEFIKIALHGYKKRRDIPGERTTSLLSPHLAFGEIAPARIWHATNKLAEDVPTEDIVHFRKELAWRDFSWHLLFHFPALATVNLNRKFDQFPWTDNEEWFDRWKRGLTGYPIIDAGMRQLWRHGWMHNRVRMIAASFLIKDLLIDWRQGERWFADTLVDADEASNATSWQWVAGSGVDAAPFFRIFSPIRQGETFDPDGSYVRRFVPEIAGLPDSFIHKPFEAPADILAKAGIKLGETYPHPVISHAVARHRALAAFQALKDVL